MHILQSSYSNISFFNDMPVIYILMVIITALVLWLIFENIRSRKNTFSLKKSENRNTIEEFMNLPVISLFYDFSYQLSGMNHYAKKHFTNLNLSESLHNQSLEQAFKNMNLLNYLDELIVKETPQNFQVNISSARRIHYYDATLLIVYDTKNHSKQLAILLHDTTALHEQLAHNKKIVQDTQNEYSKIIATKKELEKQKNELEKAFKHSSKHHIQLQKALLENERQRKQLQETADVINKQKEELKNANEEIKHHSRMKEIFFANTSHEIRTPLNAIIGFTNLLIQMNPTNTQLQYLRNIKASGDNLLIVLNDILDFSKIEAGKMTFENISFLLTEQIDYLINTMMVKADERNLKLEHYIDPNLPEVLIGDPTRLNQILINLIGNAIKFTEQGKGIVSLRINQESQTQNQVNMKFEVEDNGIGISKEKISRIFNSFTQAENETTRKYGGTGLGLAIVKQLVELQNGEIFVKSNEGEGTVFTFFLSFTIGHFSNIKKQTKNTEEKLANPEKIHLLLAEDNKINQQLALDTIKSWEENINIDVAENGKQAIDLILEKRYQMVFMDIQMPEMDGIEATRYIRNKMPEDKKYLPIIAMTAHALKNERDHFINAGMDDYISKPFAPEILTQKIIFYASEQVQNKVQNGEEFQSIIEQEDTGTNTELETSSPQSNETNFEYLDLKYLEKIYKGDYKRIKKILKMYLNAVQGEVDEVQQSYNQGDFEKTRNRAHALKPKMTYLGCNKLFESAKKIEQTLKENGNPKPLKDDVEYLSNTWPKIVKEIKIFMNN